MGIIDYWFLLAACDRQRERFRSLWLIPYSISWRKSKMLITPSQQCPRSLSLVARDPSSMTTLNHINRQASSALLHLLRTWFESAYADPCQCWTRHTNNLIRRNSISRPLWTGSHTCSTNIFSVNQAINSLTQILINSFQCLLWIPNTRRRQNHRKE